jgi:hypothetical protein
MARNTEIYTFNRENARVNLLPLINDTVLHEKSFSQFLNERRIEIGDSYNTSEEKIYEIISTDINFIQPEDLSEITFFLDEEITYNKNILEKDIGKYGINLLYEIPNKPLCFSYLYQYSNYTNYHPIDEIVDTVYYGYNISAEDFLKFNNYIILLTKKILDNGIDGYGYTEKDFTDLEKKTFEIINNKLANDNELHKIIEEEFLFLKKDVDNENNGGATQIVWYASEFFSKSIQMRENIDLQNRVVILDY